MTTTEVLKRIICMNCAHNSNFRQEECYTKTCDITDEEIRNCKLFQQALSLLITREEALQIVEKEFGGFRIEEKYSWSKLVNEAIEKVKNNLRKSFGGEKC